jgi:hypothetical protein
MEETDVQAIVRQAIDEFTKTEHAKSEPAYKAELHEERRRREQLERRVNELVEENRRSQKVAEEAERGSAVRSELQRLGVSKVDLAFKAVQDEIVRIGDGRFVGRTEAGDVPVREYLATFVNDNPEFLPARRPRRRQFPRRMTSASIGFGRECGPKKCSASGRKLCAWLHRL